MKRSTMKMLAYGIVAVIAASAGTQSHDLKQLTSGIFDKAKIIRKMVPSETYSTEVYAIPRSEIAVYDGDTIKIHGQRMRLLDIDTPEISKPRCENEKIAGYRARDALRSMLDNAQIIRIQDSGQVDRYDRPLIRIDIDGDDAGTVLRQEQLALTYRPGSLAWEARRKHWCGN